MKQTLLAILFLFLFFQLSAQSDSVELERVQGFSVKKIFVDYLGPAGGDVLDFRSYGDGFELGYNHKFHPNLELYVPFRTAVVQFSEESSQRRMHSLGAQVKWSWKDAQTLFQPYLLVGGNGVFLSGGDTDFDIPIGLGMDINIHSSTAINLQAAYHLGRENRSNVNFGIGFTHYFLQKTEDKEVPEEEEEEEEVLSDSDGDGIPDVYDLCPNEAGAKEFSGCPDSDEDGIPDHEDKCPDQAGPKSFDGCPDSDGDGVPDSDDECPNVPGPIENKGCPYIDSDGDGVPDKFDDCPNTKGPKSTAGCPDSDNDGVIDKEDKCIDTPGPASNFGCPEIEEEEQEVLDLAMESVKFESNRATLKQSSFDNLDDIATIMKKYPDYKLRISGHTDNTGSRALNQRLSEQRARSCYEYLASKGISASRMSYLGYGPDQARANNDTDEGRRLNRRVEFDVYIAE
jgi:outer membrane protein OmpA-like peptidoglycan-associated protein